MSRYIVCFTSILSIAALAATASARPDYCEMGDAGPGPTSGQHTSGSGPLDNIVGRLDGPGLVVGDFEDLFFVNITDPLSFSATTFGPGLAEFDAQLWLFFADGHGALGNDNTPPMEDARLVPDSTDGTFSLTAPGLYLIGISPMGDVPLNSMGPLFDFGDQFEISGPDGLGQADPVNSWSGGTQFGDYRIALTGCEFSQAAVPVPTVGQWAMIILFLLLLTGLTLALRTRELIPS